MTVNGEVEPNRLGAGWLAGAAEAEGIPNGEGAPGKGGGAPFSRRGGNTD